MVRGGAVPNCNVIVAPGDVLLDHQPHFVLPSSVHSNLSTVPSTAASLQRIFQALLKSASKGLTVQVVLLPFQARGSNQLRFHIFA
jgi:hypothetical protein